MTKVSMSATILADLAETKGWVCGSLWYSTYRPTFSQRISELNADYQREHRDQEGAQLIVSRPCHREDHDHRGPVYEYCLREWCRPEQQRLIA